MSHYEMNSFFNLRKEQTEWCWLMCWAGFLQRSNSKELIFQVYNDRKVRSLE
jgi:hypothetical protein